MPPATPDAAARPRTAVDRGRVVAALLRRALGDAGTSLPPAAAAHDLLPWMLRSGLGPLLWWGLRQTALADADWFAGLREEYVGQAVRTMKVDTDLARLWPLLEHAGITPLLGKGPAVALAYPERILRPFSDLDIYVPASQFARARTLADHAGLQHIVIDLHCGASHVNDIPFGRLLECADTMRVLGVDVRVLSKPHHLRLVALHALNEGMIRPLWLVDVACLIGRDAATLDWAMFDEGDEWGGRWARVALALARDVLGADLTQTPLGPVKAPRWGEDAALRSWGRQQQAKGARTAMGLRGRSVRAWLEGLSERWPTPIEAVAGVGGSVPERVVLGHQLRECVRRVRAFRARTRGSEPVLTTL